MSMLRYWKVAAIVAIVSGIGTRLVAEEFHFVHEHVLGTSLELVVRCSTEERAEQAERIVLAEIDRLDLELSGYRSDSRFARWAAGVESVQRDGDLYRVLERAEHWRIKTTGAFDIRGEAVRLLYENGAVPSDEDRHEMKRLLDSQPYRSPSDSHFERADTCEVSLNAIAKGYILDRVARVVQQQLPEITGLLINIGGDIRSTGEIEYELAITNPFDAAENSSAITRIKMHGSSAVATSGGYRRYALIAGRRFSHIVDPRTVLPVSHVSSSTVIAANGTDADALATVLSVLSIDEGLGLIAAIPETACCLVDTKGKVWTSENWPESSPITEASVLVSASDDEQDAEVSGATDGLLVDFTIASSSRRGRYRRPYVAVWLENEKGFPVKTAVLWLQKSQPGPRWHRDLTRWYRNDRTRRETEKLDLIETMSGATRGPGEYQARFDGTDNAGAALPSGKYTLCIEVAREHGSYQLIREEFNWGDTAIEKKDLKPNTEMSKVSYSFLPVAELKEKPVD